ncbi:acyl-CoA dehydrogenase family protein [Candidatus Solincola tengchongensis]|uniref:acyl-CoA dehydrogenase family protein n=1 Tax=Candidatus Solincola tengchongensis TaxID=2900693 RepID=UPI002580F1C3|nr:acyl-CoA dehydrogenase family protein [Candidatus Solincola tengchongensis]
MTIDFELSPRIKATKNMIHMFAESAIRPIARHYDENEHEKPWDLLNMVQKFMGGGMAGAFGTGGKEEKAEGAEPKEKKPRETNLAGAVTIEEIFWGDAGIALSFPGPGLGGAAVQASGTPEQKEKFLARFSGDKPVWGAMAITEPEAGSDTANIKTTAVLDGDEWVLNGEKIFVTSGKSALEDSEGFVVVWATVDRSAGRAGIKPFVVEHGTPGMQITKIEDKLGIRCSDTVSISFMDCRIPKENILGSPEVVDKTKTEGFKKVMATFDATRPLVAAMAIGVGRAALDFIKETLKEEGVELRYGINPNRMTSLERDIMQMEADLKAARLLTWRAVWMLDNGLRNDLQASMAKAKAGLAVTRITQKAVELMGPLGYSREYLLEKWMRDSKINDIFEGTGQIQLLVTARRILGFSREQLK